MKNEMTFSNVKLDVCEAEFTNWLKSKIGGIKDMQKKTYCDNGIWNIKVNYINLGYKVKNKFN